MKRKDERAIAANRHIVTVESRAETLLTLETKECIGFRYSKEEGVGVPMNTSTLAWTRRASCHELHYLVLIDYDFNVSPRPWQPFDLFYLRLASSTQIFFTLAKVSAVNNATDIIGLTFLNLIFTKPAGRSRLTIKLCKFLIIEPEQ